MVQHQAALVVPLDQFRAARQAARFLAGAVERAPWVRSVHAEVAPDGEVIVVVVVEPPLSVMRRRVLPQSVNGHPVVPREEE